MNWRDIPGWLTEAEGEELQRLARSASADAVLEIGCWKGRSTACLATATGLVLSIDHFRGDRYAGLGTNTFPEALENLRAAGADHRVRLVVADWRDVWPPVFELGRRFGLAFYDADHDYEPTREFLRAFAGYFGDHLPIAVHDYEPGHPTWEGVVRATDEFAAERGRTVRVVDRLAVLEPARCSSPA